MGELFKVFWTGGWDSTFRVLQLVLLEGKRVQPYYLLDPRRRSTDWELAAMATIRTRLLAREPAARERLEPTVFERVENVPPHPELTRRFASLKTRVRTGDQYEWLARFALSRGLDDLELCIEMERGGARPLSQLLLAQLEGEGHDCRIRASASDPDLAVVFQPFRLPCIHLTKLEMKAIAESHGFADLLCQTWFCHRPVRGRPCGHCTPCRYVVMEGLAERMPVSSLSRHYLWKLGRTLKSRLSTSVPALPLR